MKDEKVGEQEVQAELITALCWRLLPEFEIRHGC